MRQPYLLEPIGWVESSLADREEAPRQGSEGAPDAWLVFRPELEIGLQDIELGNELLVFTWLHLADRDTLLVHPRDDLNRPKTGVFSTHSPDRPNPMGLHRVAVKAIQGRRIRVGGMEAIDGTPIVDVKPVLEDGVGHRALG